MCIYIYIYIFHQSKQKRNLFVLIVFDSGEENIFLQGYCSLLVIIKNSLMWLHTLLSYMNEFLNAFLRCKHCWHKPTSWCIVCAHAKRERKSWVILGWGQGSSNEDMSLREREREMGYLGWGQGSSNENLSFVGNDKVSKLWYSSDSVFKTRTRIT